MKTVRTITLHGGKLVIPAGMTERELITLIGTLATMQRVEAVYSNDYDKTYSYTEGATTVAISQAEVYETEDQAKAARDEYNTALTKKKEEALA